MNNGYKRLPKVNFNIKHENYPFLFKFFLPLLNILFSLFNYSKEDNLPIFIKSKYSEIHLTIIGNGMQKILGDSFPLEPYDILVNGISKKDMCSKTCELESELINISLIFQEQITTCENIFKDAINIKEIDLSRFDASKVTNMFSMFYNCIKLEKINFGNINTSSVGNMRELFEFCKSIKTLDISKFDTSQVTTMYRMFGYCESLKSLDVSNFNTAKVIDMFDMFAYCYKAVTINCSSFETSQTKNLRGMFHLCYGLKYLDISNFDSSSTTTLEALFTQCNSLVYINMKNIIYKSNVLYSIYNQLSANLKLCIDDISTSNKLFGNNNYYLDCNDICFNENIKIDMEKNECILACGIDQYEYNKICYNECPDTNPIIINNNKTCIETVPNNYYFDEFDKIYKECYKSCEKCNGPGDIINNNCSKCKEGYAFIDDPYVNENNCYEICDYYYYFNESNFYFCTHNYSCPEKFSKLIIQKNKCIDDCINSNDYIYDYNNICYKNCPNETFTFENIYFCFDLTRYNNNNNTLNEVDNKIFFYQENIPIGILNSLIKSVMEDKSDFIEIIDGVYFQISTTENQKNNSNKNLSSILLDNCETILRIIYQINDSLPLILFKIDYKSNDTLIPIVEYEIYHPLNYSKLNISYCDNTSTTINYPTLIDEQKIYQYNPYSDYYTDDCSSYTTDNGTDILLYDRKKEYVDNNLSICENNCIYLDYDKDNKQSSCNCNIKSNIKSISNIKSNPNKLLNVFNLNETESKYFNYIKCTKSLFSVNGLINNISSYILLFFLFFFMFSFVIFMKCGHRMLLSVIDNIINLKLKNQNKNANTIQTKKEALKNNKLEKLKKYRRTGLRNIFSFPPKKINLKFFENNNIYPGKEDNNKKGSRKKNKSKNNEKLSQNRDNDNKKMTINKKKKDLRKIKDSKSIKNNNINSSKRGLNNTKIKFYNDYEKNTFNYELAKILEKRTCFKYYVSLLKIKHPLIFAFGPVKDYNNRIIKICIFILFFSFCYAINFIFFDDKMIHKIYNDNGKYDIIYYIPYICISFAVSHFITIIIKLLFLSEGNISSIKKQKDVYRANIMATKVKRYLRIKYLIFFILGNLFLALFWYIISSFGAVYKNTQIFIFENALISFAISLIYPFIINIFPCIFRLPALSSKNNQNEIMYKFSLFLQVL